MSDRTAPDVQLQLDWVYGYRGHQCRNNLYYTSTREIVYFVAGVGIVVDLKRQRQRFFLGHDDDIISLTVHPSGLHIATGQVGKSPYICIWDPCTVKTVSILKDQHTHGVSALSFNKSGDRLVSVGLDPNNLIVVWDWRKGRMLSNAKGHSDRIFDVGWNSQDAFVTCGLKHVKFWHLSGNSLSNKRGIFGKTAEVQTGLCVRCHNGGLTYTGMLSGDVYVWEGNNLQRIISICHVGGVFTIHSSVDGFATGGKDGIIKLWDVAFNPLTSVNLKKSAVGYKGISVRAVCWQGTHVLAGTRDGEVFEILVRDPAHPNVITNGHGEGEMWGLAVHPKQLFVATSSDDKTVRIWSIRDRALLVACSLPAPVRSCTLWGDLVAVGCINGLVRVLKSKDTSTVTEIHERKEAVHEIRFSPNGTYLAVASNDNFVDIYSVQQKYHKVGVCGKSSSFITHIDWSTDERYLQTNDGAGERLVYSMPRGSHVTEADLINVVKWHSWTCVLGGDVNGIWPKYSQINDVNAACADRKLGVVATGDDDGLVKLFKFPCVKKGGKFRKYVGHSSHVTNVRFTPDSQWLLSAGGADHALFQWKVVNPAQSGDVPDGLQPQASEAYLDSNSEDSDSSLSSVAELDSEVEKEKEATYERTVDKREVKKAISPPRGSNKRDAAPAETSLALDFVFGYRSHDCRDNIFYTESGDVLYHVAALGIVMSRETRAQSFYTGHDDDILCLALHPSRNYAATGQVGKSPQIHVWDASTMKTVSIVQGFHSRGVCSVNFSHDGRKLASVGLDNDHSLAIWDWKKGELLASARGHQDKVFSVKFDLNDSEKLVTVGIKHIKFWHHVGGGLTNKRGVFGNAGKPDTILCITQGNEAGIVYTGGASGQVYIWNGNTLAKTHKAHDGPCFAMHALDRGFVTGGRDGVISLWNERFDHCLKTYSLMNQSLGTTAYGRMLDDNPSIRAVTLGHQKILVGTKNSEIVEVDKDGSITVLTQGHCEGELWGLASHPAKNEFVTVSNDGTVRTWNAAGTDGQSYRHCCILARRLPVGGKCCAYSPDGSAIAVGCNDGSFVVVNSTTLEDMVKFHPRKEPISDIRFSPGGGKYLAVASHDNFVDIYSVNGSKRVGVCKGASSYITHIDWDESGKLLRVNTGAKELLFFEAPRGTRQTISEDANIVWDTCTGVLGKHCAGIWPPYSDVTDVNAACLSKTKQLATGDDLGFVKLFAFPVLNKHAKFKKYTGHSAHVTNVRWSYDGSLLASVGGGDTAFFVWRKNSITLQAGGEDYLGIPTDDVPVSAVGLHYHGDSEDSETDSEEEGGYDSDVAHEQNMDYEDKIYKSRDMKGVKLQKESNGRSESLVNRSLKRNPKVKTRAGLALDKVGSLALFHVFGYRGFDCRDNLHHVNEGIVYHAAGACIYHNLSTSQQSFYLEHTDDVTALAINRNQKYVGIIASGQLGETAAIRVWDLESKETKAVLKGPHRRGVCSLDFSGSGRLLLSVGLEMEHYVAIWRWQEGQIACKVSCSPRRVFRAMFRPDSDFQFVSVGVKHVRFWKSCGGAAVGKRGVLGVIDGTKMQTMLSIAFGAGDYTFTGGMNGDVYVWRGHQLNRTVPRVQDGPVFSMFTTLQDGLIVTAGKDRKKENGSLVKLWDQEMRRCREFLIPSRCAKSVSRARGRLFVGTKDSQVFEIDEKTGAYSALVRGHEEGLLCGVAAHPTSHVCCTVSKDKSARLWDLNERILLQKIRLLSGGTACAFSGDGAYIAVGMENGQVEIYDTRNYGVVATKRDRGGQINDLRFSPDGAVLAVASADQCIDLYKFADRSLQKAGYVRNVTALQLDFAAGESVIQVTTAEYERRAFRVPDGEEVTDRSAVDKMTWDTWTSTVGKEVNGIWPANAQKADINTAHVSNAANAIVTGDDSGFVKLFDFPTSEKFAQSVKFTGHSAHVTGVRFLCDDKQLVSTGGEDCCVFVWQCHA